MDASEVVQRRLTANGLAGPLRSAPDEVVGSLLAVQSQDVQPSAWSIAQRTAGGTEAVVTAARDAGRLVRTHVLRSTWHDVLAEDLRWLLRLTGPRVQQQTAAARRELHLDDAVLSTARRALEPALAGTSLTRASVAAVLGQVGLRLDGRALSHLLMHLELDAMLCSGPRSHSDHTWTLLDERVPPAPEVDHEDAVAQLAQRFLQGHGPAAVADLSWWSSLRVSDLRRALAALGDAVVRERVDDLELWSAADAPAPAPAVPVQLVQVYDEHLVAFPRSRHLSDPDGLVPDRTRPYLAVVLADGAVAGSWRRTLQRDAVTVHVAPRRALDPDALAAAADAYGAFLGRPARVVVDAAGSPRDARGTG